MRKIIIVLVLLGVILGGAGLYLVYFKKANPFQKETPTPTPNLDIVALEKNTTIFKQDSNFAVEKPVETPKYKIEYDGGARGYYVTFEVKDLGEYREVKKTAEKHFSNVGVGDLCKLKIIFVVPKNIPDGFTLQDSLPSGCKTS